MRHLARDLGEQATPVVGLVEDGAECQMQFALDDGATQDFKPAALVRRRRDV
jgi:hypothetical protein